MQRVSDGSLAPPAHLGMQFATIEVPSGHVEWFSTIGAALDCAQAATDGHGRRRVYIAHIVSVLFSDSAESAEEQARLTARLSE